MRTYLLYAQSDGPKRQASNQPAIVIIAAGLTHFLVPVNSVLKSPPPTCRIAGRLRAEVFTTGIRDHLVRDHLTRRSCSIFISAPKSLTRPMGNSHSYRA